MSILTSGLDYSIGLLPPTTLGAPTAQPTVSEVKILGNVPSQYLTAIAKFVYVAGGTSCKVYLQTSLDGGQSWFDIASFAFFTTTQTRMTAFNVFSAAAPSYLPTDATLPDNTAVQGFLGDRIRAKMISVGTYTGATTIAFSIYTLGGG